MADKTGIEWTDATWNPVRGCSPVSPGCKHCYAASIAKRFSAPGGPYEGLVRITSAGERTDDWNGTIKFVEEHLLDPLKWKPVFLKCDVCGVTQYQCLCEKFNHRPRRIFVNSMSDLYHKNVRDEWRDMIYAVMAVCPQHEFQVLTKRTIEVWDYWFLHSTQYRLYRISEAIDKLFPEPTAASIAAKERLFEGGPIANILHGFSAENQECFDARWKVMELLKRCGFRIMCSAEPLLGPIDMKGAKIDWVIAGGESGPGALPMHPDWARGLRDQCRAARVPFFFKQHGEWISLVDYDPFVHGFKADAYKHHFSYRAGAKNDDELPISCYRVGKKAAGALLDGVAYREFPQ